MRLFYRRRNVFFGLYAVLISSFIFFLPLILKADEADFYDENIFYIQSMVDNLVRENITIANLLFSTEKFAKGIAVEFEIKENGIDVMLLQNKNIVHAHCSFEKNKKITVEQEDVLDNFFSRITNKYSIIRTAKISLREAVDLVENSENGFAYKAYVEFSGNWANYKIYLLVNDKPLQVIVDIESGRIVGRYNESTDE